MHRIVTDRMPPVHIVPYSVLRVMLIKEVVFAIPLNDAVWIIHPICRWQKVIEQAVWVVGQLLAQAPGVSGN